jgi:hypothetical protein
MTAFETRAGGRGCRRWNHGLAALALACGAGAWAQVVSVPTAHLHHTEGSVAYAPHGDKEWQDVQPRRLLKRGDRLWTDRGSRAEVQASGHALRLNGETQLVLENVSETAAQLSLTQGSVLATVTHMNPGDSFEVGTPNLAFRARQPGDYRIDVDVKQGVTRLVVLSGAGVVYGEKGEALEVRNGQRLTFRERSLTRVQQPAFAATDDFDRWAGARRRGEPTVTMPTVAATPGPAAPPAPTYSGRTIIISGTAASLKNAPAAPVAKPLAVAPVAPAQVQAARPAAAQPAAGPMRVNIPSTSAAAVIVQPVLPALTPAPAAPPAQAARERQDDQRLAQEQAREERQAAARAERERRTAAEAKKADERRRAVTTRRAEDERRQAQARRAEDERRQLQAKRESEQKRIAAKRAEDERRQAQARRGAAEKRLASAREAEALKVAEQARRRQLARLQEQAQREEQAVQSRRENARRAEEERREEAFREEQARREAEVRREEQARREEEFRRQRALADQWRRDHERREQEVWLRQQQYQQQPVRPAPMGVPARRIS